MTSPPLLLEASLHEIKGEVFIRPPGQQDYTPASDNQTLPTGGQLWTGPTGFLRLDFPGGGILRVGGDTLLTLDIQQDSGGVIIKIQLGWGQVWVLTANGSVIQVDTLVGIAISQQGYMGLLVDRDTSHAYVTCLSGDCMVGNQGANLALTAAQTAWLVDAVTPPVIGQMTKAEIREWMEINPETVGLTDSLTATAQALAWNLFTPTDTLAAAIGSNTPTLVPSSTVTQEPTTTSVSYPSSTPADDPTTTFFSEVYGPPSGSITNCVFVHEVNATDPDGISWVKVEQALNPSFSASRDVKLTNIWGDRYSEPIVLNTNSNPGADTVYWRFMALDNKGNLTYYPANTPFSFVDSLNCGGKIKFSNPIGPMSGEITKCRNLFSIKAADNSERLFTVQVEYARDSSFKNYTSLWLTRSGKTWSSSIMIKTFANPGPDTVYWRFWARSYSHDSLDRRYYPESGSFSYLDDLDCGGPTRTPTLTPTFTTSPTPSATWTPTPTGGLDTDTPTATPTPTVTPTSTPTPTASDTPLPTLTPTPTDIPLP